MSFLTVRVAHEAVKVRAVCLLTKVNFHRAPLLLV
jgi:hypothetical protein